jgi:hypothetical protein
MYRAGYTRAIALSARRFGWFAIASPHAFASRSAPHPKSEKIHAPAQMPTNVGTGSA